MLYTLFSFFANTMKYFEIIITHSNYSLTIFCVLTFTKIIEMIYSYDNKGTLDAWLNLINLTCSRMDFK